MTSQPATTKSSNYVWTTGGMPGIKHEAFIASGAFGQVHKMFDQRSERVWHNYAPTNTQVFARKVIRIFGEVTKEDVENEAAVVSHICRPGQSNTVVEVYDHGWLPGLDSSYYFFDMEYCPETLEERIHHNSKYLLAAKPSAENQISNQAISPASAAREGFCHDPILNILDDICLALQYLHQQDLVHRDLKPKNVLFSLRDKHWKVADFGTASQATSKKLNTTRFSRGTSSYRAPEILFEDSRYNNKADMFALGCIIYEVIARRKLFSSDIAVWEYAAKENPLVARMWPDCVLGGASHALGRLTEELLAIKPAKRPGAAEVAKRLALIREISRRESSFVHQPKTIEDSGHGNVDNVEGNSIPTPVGDEISSLVQPVYVRVYNQGDPGIGIGGYDLKSNSDRAFEFDYLHSGTPDHLVLYRPGGGAISILRKNNGDFDDIYNKGFPGNGIGGYDLLSPDDHVFAFDYEHSGKLDYLVLYRPGAGTIWILQNKDGDFIPVYQEGCPGMGIASYDLASPADRIFAFDYDHSGNSDHLVLYRPGAGKLVIIKQHNEEFTSVYREEFSGIGGYDLTSNSDRLFAFDYSRSGKADHIFAYRRGTETICILQNKAGLFTSVFSQSNTSGGIGLLYPSARVFAYDYEGYGKPDHLVFYWPGTGSVSIFQSNNGVFTSVDTNEHSGDGIGRYDLKSSRDRMFPFAYFPKRPANQLCLYRPGTGTFWILRRF